MGPVQETRGQGRAPGLASFMDGDVVFFVLAAEALDCRREAEQRRQVSRNRALGEHHVSGQSTHRDGQRREDTPGSALLGVPFAFVCGLGQAWEDVGSTRINARLLHDVEAMVQVVERIGVVALRHLDEETAKHVGREGH